MLRFSFVILLSLFCVTACAPAYKTGHSADEKYLLSHATAGNARAQLELANYYCELAPKADKDAKAVKWWTRAAAHINPGADDAAYAAAGAMENLGEYYLALYSDAIELKSVNDKPKHYCTGRAPGDTDVAKASKWLYACAKTGLTAGFECEFGLGHLYYRQKKYAKSYFWFATVLASTVVDGMRVTHQKETGTLVFDKDFKVSEDARNAKAAAKHLKAAEVEKINKQALAWVKQRESIYGNELDMLGQNANLE